MNDENKQLLTAQAIGIPGGQILVWYMETFILNQAIPSEVAIAIGTVLGGVLHVGARIVRSIFSRRKNDDESNDDSDLGIGA